MDLQSQVTTMLANVLVALLGLGVAYFINWLHKKTSQTKAETNKLQNEEQRVLVDNAINRLSELVEKNIIAVEETIGKQVKKDITDGKIDKKELCELANLVKDNVLNQASVDVIDMANKDINDLEQYIMTEIENSLKSLKFHGDVIRIPQSEILPDNK